MSEDRGDLDPLTRAASIADATLEGHCIQPHWVRTGEQVRALIIEAVLAALKEGE